MVANICNPSAWVTKAGGFSVQDQLLGKLLLQRNKRKEQNFS